MEESNEEEEEYLSRFDTSYERKLKEQKKKLSQAPESDSNDDDGCSNYFGPIKNSSTRYNHRQSFQNPISSADIKRWNQLLSSSSYKKIRIHHKVDHLLTQSNPRPTSSHLHHHSRSIQSLLLIFLLSLTHHYCQPNH